MLKNLLIGLLAAGSVMTFAENTNASSGYSEAAQAKSVADGDNQAASSFDANKSSSSAQINSPTVNSLLYSGAQFPDQNKLQGTKGQVYNKKGASEVNRPTVNSRLYSGSQFPQQNAVTGQKKQKYYTKEQLKSQQNNPTVNSRLYSGAQFQQQNSFNNDGKTVSNKNTASAAK